MSVNVSLLDGRGYVYEEGDARRLRVDHRIVGALVGGLTSECSASFSLSRPRRPADVRGKATDGACLPVVLGPEEIALCLKRGDVSAPRPTLRWTADAARRVDCADEAPRPRRAGRPCPLCGCHGRDRGETARGGRAAIEAPNGADLRVAASAVFPPSSEMRRLRGSPLEGVSVQRRRTLVQRMAMVHQVLFDRRSQVRRRLAGVPRRPARVPRSVRRQSRRVVRQHDTSPLRLRVAGRPRRTQASARGVLRSGSPRARRPSFASNSILLQDGSGGQIDLRYVTVAPCGGFGQSDRARDG